MHPRLEAIIASLKVADPQSHESLIRAFVLDELFQFAGRSHCSFTPILGAGESLPLTSTMLTIAPSGAGKQRVKATVGLVFGAYQKAYKALIKQRVDQFNAGIEAEAETKIQRGDKASKLDAYIKAHGTNGFVSMNDQVGTVQGIAHALNEMSRLRIGSYCHRVDECSSVITSTQPATQEFMDALLSFSGGATGVSRSLKGEITELDATGIAFNLHFFGNAEQLADNQKTLNQFRSFLRKGFARRTFFTYITERVVIQREWLDMEPDASRFDTMATHFAGYFKALVEKGNNRFYFTDEAKSWLKDYIVDNQHPTGNKDADNERGDHVFKAQKLACILALVDKSFEVSKTHCEQAMQYVLASAKAYLQLLDTVEDEVHSKNDAYPCQIVDALLKGEPMNKRMLSRQLTPVPRDTTEAKWLPLIEEASKEAEELGYKLLREHTFNGMGIQYRLEAIQTTLEAVVTYSIKAPDLPDTEPKKCLAQGYEVETSTLEEFALLSSCLHTAPAIFKDGHRKSDNVEYLGNIAVFDVDNETSGEGMLSIEDAQKRLSGYQGVVIESMSSTPEQPRYRVVVVLDSPVKGVSKEAYKQLLNNIATHLGIDGAIDKACIDPSRYYAQTNREAGAGVHFAGLYGKPLEWVAFLGEPTNVARPAYHYNHTVELSKDVTLAKYHKAIRTSLARRWAVGTRNNLTYWLAKRGKDAGLTDGEIESLLHFETGAMADGLPVKEVESIVRNAGRYR